MDLKKEVVDDPNEDPDVIEMKKKTVLQGIGSVFKGFFVSVYRGGKIIFSSRKFIWLIPGYTLPLILHRYSSSSSFWCGWE